MENIVRKIQRDMTPLNDLPSPAHLAPELREPMVYCKAFHCRPNSRTLSCICFIFIGGKI